MRWGLALALLLSSGCTRTLDKFTVKRVVDRAMHQADLGKACAMGEALTHPLAAVPSSRRPPHRALVMAEATAGMCAELQAREAELAAARARFRLGKPGGASLEEYNDHKTRAERLNATAARRFDRAYQHLVEQWGPPGEGECPRVAARDEVVYLVGLISGTLSILRDKASDNAIGLPLDRVNAVSRAASCLEDDRWWQAPTALQSAGWATVPGSGPADVDPWAQLLQSAATGDETGVRVARALMVRIAANAGRTELLAQGIQSHAQSLQEHEQAAAYALLDEYARLVTLHETDLIWTAQRGHRAPRFGELPGEESTSTNVDDPFAQDPFAQDPFGPANEAAPTAPPAPLELP